MQRNLQQLANKEFDVLVIGGGITGVCIAHDAALRGLSVVLVEKNDFGACTSSASSKLLHGGIRYLPKGQVWKVRESAREQAIFQHLAPHLTRWLPFLIPTDNTSPAKGATAMKAAMLVYSLCCTGLSGLIRDPGKQAPKRCFLPPELARQEAPLLSSIHGLTGAQVLYESHMHSSERMTLAFCKTAASNGAHLANYVEVVDLLAGQGRVRGARVRDRLTDQEFDIQARLVINSAGPFVQAVNKSVPGLRLHHRLTGFSRGVHLVTRQLEPEYALALTTRKKTEGFITRGGRHFFIIPWRGRSLIGTTNVPIEGRLEDIRVTRKDIDDFLDDINEALPEVGLKHTDVYYAFTGIYPIIAKEIKPDTYQGTGEFQIVDHDKKDGISGIITALGAKFTTARHVAARAVDLAMIRLGKNDPGCATMNTPLKEGEVSDLSGFRQQCHSQYASLLTPELIDHLIVNHGAETSALIEHGKDHDSLARISPERNTLEVEVDYAVRHEMARTLDDVIFRRTGLGTIGHPGPKALQRCLDIMAEILDWDEDEQQRQLAMVEERYQYR